MWGADMTFKTAPASAPPQRGSGWATLRLLLGDCKDIRGHNSDHQIHSFGMFSFRKTRTARATGLAPNI